jgi:L-2-hydroxyglutarate oxidase LhgO
LVNACGLNAVNFAKTIEGLADDVIPQACYAKGNYFSYLGKVPFRRLIYPTPETGGLGVHLTLDLNGQARFGPDVEWVDEIDYQVNESAKLRFAAAIKTYWPACRAENLVPAYAGVRPKLGNRYRFAEDFYLQSGKDHRTPGLFNLFGIESPGLTASMAIAEHVFLTFREMS